MTTDQQWVDNPLLLALFLELTRVVFEDAAKLGSLITPEHQGRRFLEERFPVDSPETREQVLRQWLDWLRAGNLQRPEIQGLLWSWCQRARAEGGE